MNHKSLPSLCITSLALIGAASVVAGPTSPPPGPVGPTHKTLTEVEPRTAVNATNTPGDADSLFKITQPGSYYLTGSITGVSGKHGVEIVSSGVSLDLNGFDLVGIPGMGAFDGVSVSMDSLRDIAVLNGSVRNWGDEGVDLGFLSFGCRIEGVRSSGNAGIGINGGISCTITNCTASFNAQVGIRANNGSTITNCSATTNSVAGIQVNQGCTIAACTAYANSGVGMLTGVGCSVLDCSLYNNTGHGLQLGEDSAASRCSAYSNDGRGISAGNGCAISECTASFSAQEGILVGNGSTVSNSTARSNTGIGISGLLNGTIRGCSSSVNTADGISLSEGLVIDCVASSNGASGIKVDTWATVMNCTSASNQAHGIVTTGGHCLISGNNSTRNGVGLTEGHGIKCFGPDNRMVGNFCQFNDHGINVDLARSVITGNACTDNVTDWVIAANNAIGPILDRRTTGGAAVNGFSAPTTLNTTDPHANFSH